MPVEQIITERDREAELRAIRAYKAWLHKVYDVGHGGERWACEDLPANADCANPQCANRDGDGLAYHVADVWLLSIGKSLDEMDAIIALMDAIIALIGPLRVPRLVRALEEVRDAIASQRRQLEAAR